MSRDLKDVLTETLGALLIVEFRWQPPVRRFRQPESPIARTEMGRVRRLWASALGAHMTLALHYGPERTTFVVGLTDVLAVRDVCGRKLWEASP